MNLDRVKNFENFIKSKNIAVVGLGRSNLPLIEFLLKYTNNITGFDKSSYEQLSETLIPLESKGVKFSLGENYMQNLHGFEIICRTPGMRPDNPYFLKCIDEGAILTSEMEIFFELCPCKIIGVTGSDGKTTTTTIIHTLLKEEGYTTFLGGNIGRPLIGDLYKMMHQDIAVIELSSFQLMTMKRSPDVAVITNITPNHLDVHLSYQEYVNAKKNIFTHQTGNENASKNRLVLNFDNAKTRSFVNETSIDVVCFSRLEKIMNSVILENNAIVLNQKNGIKHFVDIKNILIPGTHNIENFMAAIAAVWDMVSIDTIKKVAKTFTGVEHRIELVRELNGVLIYNDSIASSPTRTIAGLRSFSQKVILIAGGCDKKLSYDVLAYEMLDTVKSLVLVGQTAPKIEASFESARKDSSRGYDIGVHKVDAFEDAVSTAYSLAKPGDVIILSPASTSFDFFKNFEERGHRFKELVMKLS